MNKYLKHDPHRITTIQEKGSNVTKLRSTDSGVLRLKNSMEELFKCIPVKLKHFPVQVLNGYGVEGGYISTQYLTSHYREVRGQIYATATLRPGKGYPSPAEKKAVPLQAWSGPEGSRKLGFPDFVTTAQDGGRLSALGTGRLYP